MYAEKFTETAISNAVADAISTAFKWGSPVNRDNRAEGGVHWSTYKAICRRNGTYANKQGPHVSKSLPQLRVRRAESSADTSPGMEQSPVSQNGSQRLGD